MRFSIKKALLAGGVLLLVAAAGGCNSATDDPDQSESVIRVAMTNPTSACIDGDGELDELGNTVFTNVLVEYTFQSIVRGSGGSAWNTVTMSRAEVVFDPANGLPTRARTFNTPVLANSTAKTSISVIDAEDVMEYFDLAAAGTPTAGKIRVTFTGRDAANNPVTTNSEISYVVANECTTAR